MNPKRIKEHNIKPPGALRSARPLFVFIYRALTGESVLRLGVWVLSGKERHSGERLALAFSGCEQYKNYWARIAFDGAFEERYLGKHWCWRVPGLIKSCGEKINLTAKQCCTYFSTLRKAPGYIYVPVSVEGDLDIDLIDFSIKSIKAVIHKIEKHEFSYEIVEEEPLLKNFIETAYLPYLVKRYPGECTPTTYRQLTRNYDRIEGLFIKKDGHRVSGMLLCYSGNRVVLKCPAIIPGYESLVKEGSLSAIDYYSILYFKEKGLDNISFGGSRPFFHDGVLAWKKKWGLRLTRTGSMVQQVRLINDNAGLRSFLIQNPCITANRDGLDGTVFISGQEELTPGQIKELTSYLWPGLNRAVIYCLDRIPLNPPQNDRLVFRSADELFGAGGF